MSGWDSLIETYLPSASSSGGGVDSDWVVEGLTKRGLPQHVAEGFAMNINDESRFNPGINERNPTVKGSRGGFGLYQLTGPRRRDYESYADNLGVAYNDPDAQLDYLMTELGGSERRSYDAMMKTTTAGEAGSVIVNEFLRPAAQHRQERSARYLNSNSTDSTPAMDFSKLWLNLGENDG